jgi:hypothetical protein
MKRAGREASNLQRSCLVYCRTLLLGRANPQNICRSRLRLDPAWSNCFATRFLVEVDSVGRNQAHQEQKDHRCAHDFIKEETSSSRRTEGTSAAAQDQTNAGICFEGSPRFEKGNGSCRKRVFAWNLNLRPTWHAGGVAAQLLSWQNVGLTVAARTLLQQAFEQI